MVATAKPYAVKNRLLAALPHEEYKRLQPQLELVQLSKRRTLYESGDRIRHAYFLNSGMGSLLALTQGGATVEIAMVGNEGMLGLPVILRAHSTPYRIMIQMPGDAMRIKAEVIRAEFKRGGVSRNAARLDTIRFWTKVRRNRPMFSSTAEMFRFLSKSAHPRPVYSETLL